MTFPVPWGVAGLHEGCNLNTTPTHWRHAHSCSLHSFKLGPRATTYQIWCKCFIAGVVDYVVLVSAPSCQYLPRPWSQSQRLFSPRSSLEPWAMGKLNQGMDPVVLLCHVSRVTEMRKCHFVTNTQKLTPYRITCDGRRMVGQLKTP